MKNDVYQIVTDRIIRLLEAGTVPWHQPWKGGTEAPQNFISRRAYPECECFVVLLLNTRRRLKGHHLVSIGTMDTILVHAQEVFRIAVIGAASVAVLVHNSCAATHKLRYENLQVMCSHRLAALTLTRFLRRKEYCANR